MDKEFSKNVVSQKDLDLIYQVFSNHPKRSALEDPSDLEFKKLPNMIDLKKWNNFSETINIIFGDSHAEFLGRFFKKVTNEMTDNQAINRTYCFWTGGTTLIGSVQSVNYYNNVLRSLTIILEGLCKKFLFKKLNIIISLGEIDIRTKLFIECRNEKIDYQEVISKYCDHQLVERFNLLRMGLNGLFPNLETKIYFKSPPPPSSTLPVRTPESYDELKLLLEKEGYPTFFEIEERKKHHALLKGSIKRACLMSGIEFLKGFYKNEDSLNLENSHDGAHISCGDWAMKNSRQIFLDI